jgi:hypothetical protein
MRVHVLSGIDNEPRHETNEKKSGGGHAVRWIVSFSVFARTSLPGTTFGISTFFFFLLIDYSSVQVL